MYHSNSHFFELYHPHKIFSIPGVNRFGIGMHGFEVDLLSYSEESRSLIPDTLEGIPVTVTVVDEMAEYSTIKTPPGNNLHTQP